MKLSTLTCAGGRVGRPSREYLDLVSNCQDMLLELMHLLLDSERLLLPFLHPVYNSLALLPHDLHLLLEFMHLLFNAVHSQEILHLLSNYLYLLLGCMESLLQRRVSLYILTGS